MYNDIPSSHTTVYHSKEGDLHVSDISATQNGSKSTLHSQAGTSQLELNIPGTYNLENAQCAIGLALSVGVSIDNAVNALKTFEPMPGRMELIDEGQDFKVFVDFTMTANGYQKSLEALRDIVGENKKVLVLGSCCGNRMKEKRSEVGRVCSEFADIVAISEDETYGEDPHKVQEEVWAGVDQSETDAHKIFDRREAITFLFKKAGPGDAVILCGMGPFGYMTKLEGTVEWDEREVAREILRSL